MSTKLWALRWRPFPAAIRRPHPVVSACHPLQLHRLKPLLRRHTVPRNLRYRRRRLHGPHRGRPNGPLSRQSTMGGPRSVGGPMKCATARLPWNTRPISRRCQTMDSDATHQNFRPPPHALSPASTPSHYLSSLTPAARRCPPMLARPRFRALYPKLAGSGARSQRNPYPHHLPHIRQKPPTYLTFLIQLHAPSPSSKPSGLRLLQVASGV